MSASPQSLAANVPCNPEGIPIELRGLRQWVGWRLMPSEKPGDKPRKIPVNAATGQAASTKDPNTWSTYEVAVAAFRRGGLAGIGFVFTAADPYTGIDLDNCIDSNGQLAPWASAIVARFNTYTERSPSGTGLKMILAGKKPEGSACRGAAGTGLEKAECYGTGRFFALTGVPWPGTPANVAEQQTQLEDLIRAFKPGLTGGSALTSPQQRSGAAAQKSLPGSTNHGADRPPESEAQITRRAIAYLKKMEPSISGSNGHGRAYAAATALVHGFELPTDLALKILLEHFNPRCQPEWSEKELRHKVDDAGTKSHESPRGWLLHAALPNGNARAHTLSEPEPGTQSNASQASGEPPAPNGKAIVSKIPKGPRPCTDAGNAERFARKYASRLRYCHETKEWIVWDRRRWHSDNKGLPISLAVKTARSIHSEAAACDDLRQRVELSKWALRSESSERLNAMVNVARSTHALAASIKSTDVDPWSFNVQNGTIDLQTGNLRPHRREDLITQLAPVEFHQSAECPEFKEFLHRIFDGNKEMIGFVKRLFGHALTGDIREQIMPVFHGEGSNGKSVLVDTVASLMGSYAGQAPPKLLVVTTREEHPAELADLRNKRLVIASETEQTAILKIQLIKKLTGDQRIKARGMGENFFEFDRTHKLILVTNHMPRILDNSHGAWRRIKCVPFNVIIPDKDQNNQLLELLRSERPGILNWLVEGCLEWLKDGLGFPKEVVEGTQAYRDKQDLTGRFLSDWCIVDPPAPHGSRSMVRWTVLFDAYLKWSHEEGEVAIAGSLFGQELTRRGFLSETKRKPGEKPGKFRMGLSLCFDSRALAA